MAEYHVSCGVFGIYAGTLKNKDEWEDKSQVTDEAVAAVAQYLLESGKSFKFTLNGTPYRMSVRERKEEA